MSFSPEEKERLRAFTLMASRYTVPLIEEDEKTAAILGSGTLFSVNSKHYLITAAHVIDELVKAKRTDRIGIPLGRVGSPVCNLGKHYITYDLKTEIFDIAIIRLDQPEMAAALATHWNFLSPRNIAGLRSEIKKCFVAGYPRATSRTTADWQMSSTFMAFATTFLDRVPDDAQDVRDGLDVFLDHEEKGTALDGTLVELPRLQGVSGASVWSVLPDSRDGVWNAESQVRVVAVDVACRPGSYIRAKSWALVAKLFEALDGRAAEEIKEALSL